MTFRMLCLNLIGLLLPNLAALGADTWPQFRGPTGQGLSDATGLPVVWSETTNRLWRIDLPGLGHASPVISGNRIWLAAATTNGLSRRVMEVDAETGALLRDDEVFACDRAEVCHALNSYATPTPVLEDGRLYVTFGPVGTACIDTETGRKIWERRDLSPDYYDVGPASSPILYKNLLVLTCDGAATNRQFVAALDKTTGRTVWRTDRTYVDGKTPTHAHSSSTPLTITVDGMDQLVSPGPQGVRAYDPASGEELWKARYNGWSVVPRPVYADGRLFVINGTSSPLMLAIRPMADSRGDLTDTPAVLWKKTKDVPNMPSPIYADGNLYTLTARALLRLDPATGEARDTLRLPGEYLASPLLADGRIFCFSRTGIACVVAAAPGLPMLATNRLETGCMASPAVYGSSLIVRTTSSLYRIQNK